MTSGETFFRTIAAARSAADIQQRSLLFMVAAIVSLPCHGRGGFRNLRSCRSPDEPIGVLLRAAAPLVEAAEVAGFRTYHVAEHHATRLGMAPSPGIFLAAVAQRTRRIRFGPLVYLLPALHAAPARRGDRHARPDERRTLRAGSRPRHLAVRAGLLRRRFPSRRRRCTRRRSRSSWRGCVAAA